MSNVSTRTADGLEVGSPTLKSVGPIAFGPDGILFVADNAAATIYAIKIEDEEQTSTAVELEDLDTQLASMLGCARDDVAVRDLAVHPTSGAAYLSVVRGVGDTAVPLIVRVGSDGALTEVSLTGATYAQASIADAPAADDERLDRRVLGPGEPGGDELTHNGITLRITSNSLRTSTVTDLAYVDGFVLAAGASNEEFVSTLRRIPYPFGSAAESTPLEIYHVSHGKWETESPIRTFMPYDGGTSILASYTCTPLVHFRLDELTAGTRAVGRTVAELGFMNTPLDIVEYEHGGEAYLLVAHTRHALMKIACSDIDRQDGLTTPHEPTGAPFEKLPHVGVRRMATVNGHVLMLQFEDGALHLRAYEAASL